MYLVPAPPLFLLPAHYEMSSLFPSHLPVLPFYESQNNRNKVYGLKPFKM